MKTILKHYSYIDYPKESCGFILKNNTYVPTLNISDDPENYFRINPLEYLKYSDNILAVFHSHTKGSPVSSFDINSCNNTYLPWVIYILPDTFEIIYPEGYEGDRINL